MVLSEVANITTDLLGTIRSCNAEAERLLGYRAAELVGQSIKLLIPKERQAEHDAMLARIGRGERVALFETVYLARDRRHSKSRWQSRRCTTRQAL